MSRLSNRPCEWVCRLCSDRTDRIPNSVDPRRNRRWAMKRSSLYPRIEWCPNCFGRYFERERSNIDSTLKRATTRSDHRRKRSLTSCWKQRGEDRSKMFFRHLTRWTVLRLNMSDSSIEGLIYLFEGSIEMSNLLFGETRSLHQLRDRARRPWNGVNGGRIL